VPIRGTRAAGEVERRAADRHLRRPRINTYDPASGRFLGALRDERGGRIAIDGPCTLEFGNGVIGTPQTLLSTAGPNEETHGLFGELRRATRGDDE
jgi:hypothetical protein